MMTWTARLLVFPLKDRSKEPATSHGHLDAKPFEEWTVKATNWGIRCGPESGITVIDVDPRNGGDIQQVLPLLPLAPRVKTGGGGWHFYCQGVPAGTHFIKLPGIDFKNNGYVVAPGSIHPSGAPYEWEQEGDLPEFPASFIKPPASLPRVEPSGFFPDDITDMLGAIPSEDRDTWLHVGMALHSVDPGLAGFELWHEWSKSARSYKGIADCNKVWNSFRKSGITLGTLVKLALDHGYKRSAPLVDLGGQFAPRERPTIKEPDDLPFTPTIPVFLLEEIRRWAVPACDPVSAIAVALTIGSLMVARTVTTDKGDLPMVQFALVGPTASSGIIAGDSVEKALREASLGWMLRGGTLSSEEKLKRALLASPVLYHFTHTWAANVQFSQRQPSGAMSAAIALFDRILRGSPLRHENEKKPDEEPTVIFDPHLALIVSVGQDELQKILTTDEMSRGSHEMMLYVPLRTPGEIPSGPLPSSVLRRLAGPALQNSLPPSSREPASFSVLKIRDPEGVSDDPLYRTSKIIARRIALILSAVDNPSATEVSDSHLAWAMKFVEFCARSLKPEESAGDGRMTPYDYVAAFAKKQKTRGFTPRDLVQGVKPFRNLKRENRNSLIDLMLEDGLLVSVPVPGKRVERLYHRDFVKKGENEC